MKNTLPKRSFRLVQMSSLQVTHLRKITQGDINPAPVLCDCHPVKCRLYSTSFSPYSSVIVCQSSKLCLPEHEVRGSVRHYRFLCSGKQEYKYFLNGSEDGV
jgi:hypothetical protein